MAVLKKIGMCMACGGSFSPSKTVAVAGGEYCHGCAEMINETKAAKPPKKKPVKK